MTHADEGKVFPVLPGAVHLLFVMVDVHTHVSKGGNQKRETADQIPYNAEEQERAFSQMCQFMDEDNGPIKAKDRDGKEEELLPTEVPGQNGEDKSHPSQWGVEKKIGPIEPGIGFEQVLDYFFGFYHREGWDFFNGHRFSFLSKVNESGREFNGN